VLPLAEKIKQEQESGFDGNVEKSKSGNRLLSAYVNFNTGSNSVYII
jgi:hypothetical protein